MTAPEDRDTAAPDLPVPSRAGADAAAGPDAGAGPGAAVPGAAVPDVAVPPRPPLPEREASDAPDPSNPWPQVDIVTAAFALPGAHRGGFTRLPTAPTPITSQSAPREPGTDTDPTPVAQWLMPEESPPYRGLAGWALGFAVIGLLVSMFVGWGFPIGLVAIISAIVALFRPLESRAMSIWALVLGTVSVLYSAGWLYYAAQVANIWG
jgi:hypothetical protein